MLAAFSTSFISASCASEEGQKEGQPTKQPLSLSSILIDGKPHVFFQGQFVPVQQPLSQAPLTSPAPLSSASASASASSSSSGSASASTSSSALASTDSDDDTSTDTAPSKVAEKDKKEKDEKDKKAEAPKTVLINSFNLPKGFSVEPTITKEQLAKLLATKGCVVNLENFDVAQFLRSNQYSVIASSQAAQVVACPEFRIATILNGWQSHYHSDVKNCFDSLAKAIGNESARTFFRFFVENLQNVEVNNHPGRLLNEGKPLKALEVAAKKILRFGRKK